MSHLNHGWRHTPRYGHYGHHSRWRYHDHYYSRHYHTRSFGYYDGLCRYNDNGSATAVGAILGAIIGGAAAHDDDVGVGILLGAGFGALLGNSIGHLDDCDRAQYQYAVNYAFEHGNPYYWGNPHSGVRGVIYIRESYNYSGSYCRYGDAEIYMPDGRFHHQPVRMCRDAYGDWQVAQHQY